MFVVLCPEEASGRGLWARNRKNSVGIHTLEGSAMRFYTVRVPMKKGRVQWDTVAKTAGGCKGRIIAPLSVKLPEGYGLSEFYSTRFAAQMVLESALELLREARITPQGMSVCLIDRQAVLVKGVCDLLSFARQVTVVTQRAEDYLPAVGRAMREYGAGLVISKRPVSALVEIVCPEKKPENALYTVISAEGTVIEGKGIDCVSGLDSVVPEGIDYVSLAAACAELCGDSRMRKAKFASLLCNGHNVSLSQAAAELAMRAEKVIK